MRGTVCRKAGASYCFAGRAKQVIRAYGSIVAGGKMPQRINSEKSNLTLYLRTTLRKRLVKACEEDDKRMSDVVREAVRKWLDARDRRNLRAKHERKPPASQRADT